LEWVWQKTEGEEGDLGKRRSVGFLEVGERTLWKGRKGVGERALIGAE
jgi:hypothetical protein